MSAPVTGTFGATGNSASLAFKGGYNVSVWGTFVATIQRQRSFDDGVTWLAVGADITVIGELSDDEPEFGVIYRLECTVYTSGTVNYRLGANNV